MGGSWGDKAPFSLGAPGMPYSASNLMGVLMPYFQGVVLLCVQIIRDELYVSKHTLTFLLATGLQ